MKTQSKSDAYRRGEQYAAYNIDKKIAHVTAEQQAVFCGYMKSDMSYQGFIDGYRAKMEELTPKPEETYNSPLPLP